MPGADFAPAPGDSRARTCAVMRAQIGIRWNQAHPGIAAMVHMGDAAPCDAA